MLVLRYFGYVGGALLTLLFVCNAVLPKEQLPGVLNSGSDLPTIRIHSEKKWPERVVFDTSMVPVAAAPVAVAKAETPPVAPAAVAQADPITAKARVREAFAQFTPGEPKVEPKAEPKPAVASVSKPQPKRKVAKMVAKVHVGRPLVLAAQQPRFGLFDTTW